MSGVPVAARVAVDGDIDLRREVLPEDRVERLLADCDRVLDRLAELLRVRVVWDRSRREMDVVDVERQDVGSAGRVDREQLDLVGGGRGEPRGARRQDGGTGRLDRARPAA